MPLWSVFIFNGQYIPKLNYEIQYWGHSYGSEECIGLAGSAACVDNSNETDDDAAAADDDGVHWSLFLQVLLRCLQKVAEWWLKQIAVLIATI